MVGVKVGVAVFVVVTPGRVGQGVPVGVFVGVTEAVILGVGVLLAVGVKVIR
jgi:hypothetical protein